jgi:protein-S-isoprenylcysteine O-methyltransferase Ste14
MDSLGSRHGAGYGAHSHAPAVWRVSRGKSFVYTKRLIDTGIYAAVRHPQCLGGILAVFTATVLLYPHWLFVVLGIPGIIILYLSTPLPGYHWQSDTGW